MEGSLLRTGLGAGGESAQSLQFVTYDNEHRENRSFVNIFPAKQFELNSICEKLVLHIIHV